MSQNDAHKLARRAREGAVRVMKESSPPMDCSIVDVFAERPLAGNQLAVIRRCGHLDTGYYAGHRP